MEAVDDGDWWVVGGQDEEVLFPRGPECPFVFFFPGEPMEVASILRTCLSSERVVTMRRKILSASSCWPNATQASPYAWQRRGWVHGWVRVGMHAGGVQVVKGSPPVFPDHDAGLAIFT